MQYKITPPTHIEDTIQLPASKSISNRALIIHALAGGNIMPENLSTCDDTAVIARAFKDNPYEIDIMAAGTAMRFMTAYLSVTEGEHVLTGTERMKQRPIKILVDALRSLGADIQYVGEEGFPPLRIKGKSSQYVSALLMIGPTLEKGLELKLLGNVISRPYIDLTLNVMHEYGADAEWTDIDTITIRPKRYEERSYTIENDWTSASYWYAILTLLNDRKSYIRFTGLKNGSRQGDSAIKYIFSLLGVKTCFADKEMDELTDVTITQKPQKLPRLEYDFKNQPDLAQTLMSLCPIMNIPFKFMGLSSLKLKETDRIEAMKTEMAKLGYVLHDINDSEMSWDGERCEVSDSIVIDTYKDHRMAMTFAPLSIKLGELFINNPEVVSKSYPHFWNDLQKAGFIIEEIK